MAAFMQDLKKVCCPIRETMSHSSAQHLTTTSHHSMLQLASWVDPTW
jgi:hypothetical protein